MDKKRLESVFAWVGIEGIYPCRLEDAQPNESELVPFDKLHAGWFSNLSQSDKDLVNKFINKSKNNKD